MKNKSHKKVLNKIGRKIDPWETPKKISSHELYTEFAIKISKIYERFLPMSSITEFPILLFGYDSSSSFVPIIVSQY